MRGTRLSGTSLSGIFELADSSLHGASLGGNLGLADATLRGASLSDTLLLADALLRGVSLSGTYSTVYCSHASYSRVDWFQTRADLEQFVEKCRRLLRPLKRLGLPPCLR